MCSDCSGQVPSAPLQVMAVDACKASNPEAHAKFLRLAEGHWKAVCASGHVRLFVSDWQAETLETQVDFLRSFQPELTESQARVLARAINELLGKCT